MEALNFVPKYPALGHLFAASALLGIPMTLRALVIAGGPARTRLASLLGFLLASALTVLTLSKGNNLFAWHIIGMACAVFGLQPAALHSILAKHSFNNADTRASRAMDHKLLQMAVVGSVGGGFLAIFLNKPAGFPGKHFMSVHSLVGLAAIFLMVFNTLHGAYRQGSPLSPKFNWVSRLHRVTGTFAFCLSISAAMLGLFNRTVVVDWEQRPIRFSLPDGWNQMGGWAASTHGVALAWAFIGTAFVILILMMLPGRGPPVTVPGNKRK